MAVHKTAHNRRDGHPLLPSVRRRRTAARWCPPPAMAIAVFLLLPAYVRVAAQGPAKLTGRFLVATSRLKEAPFAESVVLIVRHSEGDGAFGLIVNKPMTKMPFSKILRRKPSGEDVEVTVYYGGPVDRRRGFLLHSSDQVLSSSDTILEGVAMTMDADMLQAIAEGHGPSKYLFAIGYSGWRPNQLESEINLGSWFTVDADPGLIFTDQPLKTWKQLFDNHVLRL